MHQTVVGVDFEGPRGFEEGFGGPVELGFGSGVALSIFTDFGFVHSGLAGGSYSELYFVLLGLIFTVG